jgi:hypothetical protein
MNMEWSMHPADAIVDSRVAYASPHLPCTDTIVPVLLVSRHSCAAESQRRSAHPFRAHSLALTMAMYTPLIAGPPDASRSSVADGPPATPTRDDMTDEDEERALIARINSLSPMSNVASEMTHERHERQRNEEKGHHLKKKSGGWCTRLHWIIYVQSFLLMLCFVIIGSHSLVTSDRSASDAMVNSAFLSVAPSGVDAPAPPPLSVVVTCPTCVSCHVGAIETDAPSHASAVCDSMHSLTPKPAPFSFADSFAATSVAVPPAPHAMHSSSAHPNAHGSATSAHRPLANFTVPPILQERGWPLKPDTGRGIVVSLLSVKTVGELQKCFEGVDEFLLAPFNITWLLVFEKHPADVSPMLREFVAQNGLVRIDHLPPSNRTSNEEGRTSIASVRARPEGEIPMNGGVFRTKRGAIIRMHGIIMATPRYLEEDPTLLDADHWMCCGGNEWSWEYIHYNTFFVYHLAQLSFKELDGYDYFMKMDTDIIWHAQPPSNPFTTMGNRECVFAHTAYYDGWQDCHVGAYEAMQAYGQTYGIKPRSEDKDWCTGFDYFYGHDCHAHHRHTFAQLLSSVWRICSLLVSRVCRCVCPHVFRQHGDGLVGLVSFG